jgi:hypothetical protein
MLADTLLALAQLMRTQAQQFSPAPAVVNELANLAALP